MMFRQRFEQVFSTVRGLRSEPVSPRDLARQRLAAILGGSADETDGRSFDREEVNLARQLEYGAEKHWDDRAKGLGRESSDQPEVVSLAWYDRLLKRQEDERRVAAQKETTPSKNHGNYLP